MTSSTHPLSSSIDGLVARCVSLHRKLHDEFWPLARKEPELSSREYAELASHVGEMTHEAKRISAAAEA